MSGTYRRSSVQNACIQISVVFLGILVARQILPTSILWTISSLILGWGKPILRLAVFCTCTALFTVALTALLSWCLSTHVHERQRIYVRERFRHGLQSVPKLALPNTHGNFFIQSQAELPQPFVFPESETTEGVVSELLTVIIERHVESWYQNISERPLFPGIVERLLRQALISLKERLRNVDVVGIVVRRAVPVITQHLHELTIAELQVMDKVKAVGLDALEHSSISDAVAANCKERALHVAAQTPEHDQADILAPEDRLQSYLRGLVTRLLPILLPTQELASPVVTIFVREILTCAVLEPLFSMLADPDFWNELLVVRANQVIQERARVKRFRHALKEQTLETHRKSMKKRPMRNLERLMVSKDPKDWDRLYRKIKKSQSLTDVTRMRTEIMVLKNEMLAAAYATDDLIGPVNTVRQTSKSDHFVIKAMGLLEGRMASLGGTTFNPTSLGSPRNLSFDRTLAIGVTYFSEFLERRGRVELLDYWQSVIQIKLKTTQPMPSSQLSVLDSPVHLSKTEIKRIFRRYFDSGLLTITDDEKALIRNYVEREPDTYDVDSNEIIVAVARRAYRTMETDDYTTFRHDKLYFNMITGLTQDVVGQSPLLRSNSSTSIKSRVFGLKSANRSTSDLTELERDYLDNETMGMIDHTERDVLEAMEDALQSPLMTESTTHANLSDVRGSVLPDGEGTGYASSDGDDDTKSLHGMTPITRLDAPSLVDSSISDLRTADPGDLNLVEQIDALDCEIRKRQHSLTYIDKFLTNKRDIDETDRKIVIKSRTQTTRELETLLTQKRQYEADDHALYGRSSISIDDTMTHQDQDGNDFVVYVIEVRRVGLDGTQTGWIITRRYSEFNQLHAQLKHHFPNVALLDFPKKQLNRLKSVVDVRRPILEAFLQSLLKDERICKSLELRTFLSQNNLTVKKRPHKSVLENLIGLTDPREAFSRLFAMLETPDDVAAATAAAASGRHSDNPHLREVHPPPPPPESHAEEEISSFAKPIVDLVLEAFDLRERSKWIKKRAVVLVLQQILGGTIESRVRDHLSALFEEKARVAMLSSLKQRFSEDAADSGARGRAAGAGAGASRDDARGRGPGSTSSTGRTGVVVKTRAERQRLMDLAKETLRAYNPSYVPETAARKVFRALQIKTLNMHLLGKVTDSVFDAIFHPP